MLLNSIHIKVGRIVESYPIGPMCGSKTRFTREYGTAKRKIKFHSYKEDTILSNQKLFVNTIPITSIWSILIGWQCRDTFLPVIVEASYNQISQIFSLQFTKSFFKCKSPSLMIPYVEYLICIKSNAKCATNTVKPAIHIRFL